VSARASPDWTFGGAWPFRPRWFDSPDGQMHYIDEGPRDGRPVVLVHGNPSAQPADPAAGTRRLPGPLAALRATPPR
jgi:pimeloyl-ACP methyl ester carboxylesterase